MLPRDRQLPASGHGSSARRQLPDYRSRAARWRLFVLVAALMAVLVAMNEARNPRTWAWLWHGQPRTVPVNEPIQTRLPPQPEPTHSLPGTVYTNRSTVIDRPSTATDKSSGPGRDEVSASEERMRRVWQRVWEALTYDEKNQFTRLLRTARRGANAAENDTRAWEPLAAKLNAIWNEVLAAQNRDVLLPATEIPAEQRHTALQVLTELETAWNSRLKPAIDSASQSGDWTVEQRTALAEIQNNLDAIALAIVRDDTVWRPDERTAWFRLLEILQQSKPAALAQQSVGHVGFVQIFRQPQEYRGKVVTIRGTARMAYRITAPANDLGISEYCLFWIQPEDGVNLPIVVYALRPPEGFPTVTTEQQKIHEAVEVTGYFFKRWVYRAADGLNSVPLIVAAAPTRIPRTPPETAHQQLATTLGPYFWLVIASGVACLAVAGFGIAWLVNWSSRPSPALAELRAAAHLPVWDNLPATPSVEESLRNLEDIPPVN